jgi:hypothetical protein
VAEAGTAMWRRIGSAVGRPVTCERVEPLRQFGEMPT